jgi:hypothetical protein
MYYRGAPAAIVVYDVTSLVRKLIKLWNYNKKTIG